jgi:hypothetical protein
MVLALGAGPTARFDVKSCFGMCDASAVVALDEDLFVAGDDEDNYLRVYSRRTGGSPVFITNVSRFLGFKRSSGETDIEGAARVGDLIYWISSHGRNARAKMQPRRQRFFATTGAVRDGKIDLQPVGIFYAGLLRDLTRDPRLAPFNLARASLGAPKAIGALNIEGLVATPEGHLLIGFRNPIPHGRALIVPLLNPSDLIHGRPARLGDPMLLDLGGLGVRGMTRWRDQYLIIAGSSDGDGVSRLYQWSGGNHVPRWFHCVDFTGLNPEAITPVAGEYGSELLVLSDDGTVICDGVECKRLKDPARKRFRLALLETPSDP